jgi:hypothetical protein
MRALRHEDKRSETPAGDSRRGFRFGSARQNVPTLSSVRHPRGPQGRTRRVAQGRGPCSRAGVRRSRNHRQPSVPARLVRPYIARRCEGPYGGFQVVLEGRRYTGGLVPEEPKRWLTSKWSRRARRSRAIIVAAGARLIWRVGRRARLTMLCSEHADHIGVLWNHHPHVLQGTRARPFSR